MKTQQKSTSTYRNISSFSGSGIFFCWSVPEARPNLHWPHRRPRNMDPDLETCRARRPISSVHKPPFYCAKPETLPLRVSRFLPHEKDMFWRENPRTWYLDTAQTPKIRRGRRKTAGTVAAGIASTASATSAAVYCCSYSCSYSCCCCCYYCYSAATAPATATVTATATATATATNTTTATDTNTATAAAAATATAATTRTSTGAGGAEATKQQEKEE